MAGKHRWRVCGWLAALLGALTMSARLVCALSGSSGLSEEAAWCSSPWRTGVSADQQQRGILFYILSSVLFGLAARLVRKPGGRRHDSKRRHSPLQVVARPRPAGYQQTCGDTAAAVPELGVSHINELAVVMSPQAHGRQQQQQVEPHQGCDPGAQPWVACQEGFFTITASPAPSATSKQAAAGECLAVDLAAAAGAVVCIVRLPGARRPQAQPAATSASAAVAMPLPSQQQSATAVPPHVEYSTSIVCAPAATAVARPAPHSSSALYRSPMQHHLCSIKLPTTAASAMVGPSRSGAGDPVTAVRDLLLASVHDALQAYSLQAHPLGSGSGCQPLVVHCAGFHGCVQVVVWLAAPWESTDGACQQQQLVIDLPNWQGTEAPAALTAGAAAAGLEVAAAGSAGWKLDTILEATQSEELLAGAPACGHSSSEASGSSGSGVIHHRSDSSAGSVADTPRDATGSPMSAAAVPNSLVPAAGGQGAGEAAAGVAAASTPAWVSLAQQALLQRLPPNTWDVQLQNGLPGGQQHQALRQQVLLQPCVLPYDPCGRAGMQGASGGEAAAGVAPSVRLALPAHAVQQLAQRGVTRLRFVVTSDQPCASLADSSWGVAELMQQAGANAAAAAGGGQVSAAEHVILQVQLQAGGYQAAAAAAAGAGAGDSCGSLLALLLCDGAGSSPPAAAGVLHGAIGGAAACSYLLCSLPLLVVPPAAAVELEELLPRLVGAAATAAGQAAMVEELGPGASAATQAVPGPGAVTGPAGMQLIQLARAYTLGLLPVLQDLALLQQALQQGQGGSAGAQQVAEDLAAYFTQEGMPACRQLCSCSSSRGEAGVAAAAVVAATAATVQPSQHQHELHAGGASAGTPLQQQRLLLAPADGKSRKGGTLSKPAAAAAQGVRECSPDADPTQQATDQHSRAAGVRPRGHAAAPMGSGADQLPLSTSSGQPAEDKSAQEGTGPLGLFGLLGSMPDMGGPAGDSSACGQRRPAPELQEACSAECSHKSISCKVSAAADSTEAACFNNNSSSRRCSSSNYSGASKGWCGLKWLGSWGTLLLGFADPKVEGQYCCYRDRQVHSADVCTALLFLLITVGKCLHTAWQQQGAWLECLLWMSYVTPLTVGHVLVALLPRLRAAAGARGSSWGRWWLHRGRLLVGAQLVTTGAALVTIGAPVVRGYHLQVSSTMCGALLCFLVLTHVLRPLMMSVGVSSSCGYVAIRTVEHCVLMYGCEGCPTPPHILRLQLLCGIANILLATVKDARMRAAFLGRRRGAEGGSSSSSWKQVGSWFVSSRSAAPGSSCDVCSPEADAVLRVQQWLQEVEVAGASHCKTD